MTDQQQEMIEYTIQEVVRYLVEDEEITMEQFRILCHVKRYRGKSTRPDTEVA